MFLGLFNLSGFIPDHLLLPRFSYLASNILLKRVELKILVVFHGHGQTEGIIVLVSFALEWRALKLVRAITERY